MTVYQGLTLNCGLEVLRGAADTGKVPQVPFGMNALRLRGGSKQTGDVGQPIQLRFLRKRAIFLIGLAFARKRFLEIVVRFHEMSPYCPRT